MVDPAVTYIQSIRSEDIDKLRLGADDNGLLNFNNRTTGSPMNDRSQSKSNNDDVLHFRSSYKGRDRKLMFMPSNQEFKQRALDEIERIEKKQQQENKQQGIDPAQNVNFPVSPTNTDRLYLDEYLNQILEEDLITFDKLDELKDKELGGYQCYRGDEYLDEDREMHKGRLLFYLKQLRNSLMVGIQVPPTDSDDNCARPHLFKIVKGIRIENQFYIECQTSYSLFRIGYVGTFGFKDGVQTMEGRMIDSVDEEKEYVVLMQDTS